MNCFLRSLFIPLLLVVFSLSACQSSTDSKPKPHRWSVDDSHCKVIGMQYICQRECRSDETGPSGAQCITKARPGSFYCDCGTVNRGPK